VDDEDGYVAGEKVWSKDKVGEPKVSELRALRLETYIGSYILEFSLDKRGGTSSIWQINQKFFNGVALWAYFGAKAMLSSRYRG
jgi:hypothetical protein